MYAVAMWFVCLFLWINQSVGHTSRGGYKDCRHICSATFFNLIASCHGFNTPDACVSPLIYVWFCWRRWWLYVQYVFVIFRYDYLPIINFYSKADRWLQPPCWLFKWIGQPDMQAVGDLIHVGLLAGHHYYMLIASCCDLNPSHACISPLNYVSFYWRWSLGICSVSWMLCTALYESTSLQQSSKDNCSLFISGHNLRADCQWLPWFLCSTAEPMQHPHQCWRWCTPW